MRKAMKMRTASRDQKYVNVGFEHLDTSLRSVSNMCSRTIRNLRSAFQGTTPEFRHGAIGTRDLANVVNRAVRVLASGPSGGWHFFSALRTARFSTDF
ncbi:hypothetical protein KIN20_032537 [Parelaphostrongylus tenuis]|uniref:Uncharacterized protein n=1 Tax=Parelaphostrongylus tenuis TaxID=148309 RepID=A0AAD5R7A4_PARTN|nr:hypothetical protein KIN20_032537 [Parelaphostrongylus tenuis]